MKALRDTQAADRISTREELFQVLDLLIGLRDPEHSGASLISAVTARLGGDPYAESADLLSDTGQGQEPVLASDMAPLTEYLLGKHERSN